MNPQPEEDLQRRLRNLEAQMHSQAVDVGQSPENRQKSPSAFVNLKSHVVRLQLWFENLNRITKVIVAGVGVLVGLAMLQAVMKLVASVITVAVLAFFVYLGYKFFVSGSFEKKQ